MKLTDWMDSPKTTKKILFYITYAVVLVFAIFNLTEIL